MSNSTTPPPQVGQNPPTGEPPGQNPNQSMPIPGQNPPPALTSGQHTSLETFPPELQDYIRSLREESKTLRKHIEAETQKKQQEEEARLREQGQWKSLAEQHEARVKQLEPISERYTTLSAEVGKQIEDEIKDWPKSVKQLDPGKDAPIEQRLQWRNNARAIVTEMGVAAQGQAPGNPPNPPAAGGGGTSNQNIDELRRRYQTTRGNPF